MSIDQKNIKKILVIRFSSIGDIAWTSTVVRCLKQQIKGVKVHFAIKKGFRALMETNPYVDKLHLLDGSMKPLIAELKAEEFDFIVDLHNNLRTARIKWALNAPSSTYDKLRIKRFLYTNFQINYMPNVHVTDRYMDAVRPLGVVNDQEGMDYFIPEKDEVEKEWLPEEFQKGYIAYVIGGTKFTKILPFEKMVELCDKISRPIVLVGGPEDQKNGERLEEFFKKQPHNAPYEEGLKELGKKTVIFNGCGKFSLNQSASLVKHADYVFGHDTGLTHIAAAFKKTIYSIWGGTVPNNFHPYGTKFFVFENNKLSCRPCSKSGLKKCPKGHFKCMKDLTFDFYLP
ncbi:glycosyltransferase family 9 protein [Persicobacter psychrovividus]|uniref:LPS biosynthesis protein n=1 Tax=Persicobacter psychrovividus TaxID=387638 RepID=A0ABM7VE09_9BACT|nr:LPS biosynthesis protein [Persicobacter psychrovividus]